MSVAIRTFRAREGHKAAVSETDMPTKVRAISIRLRARGEPLGMSFLEIVEDVRVKGATCEAVSGRSLQAAWGIG